jgi:hypothetical protein
MMLGAPGHNPKPPPSVPISDLCLPGFQGPISEIGLQFSNFLLPTFYRARELAGMAKYDFGRLLGRRGIERHYGLEDLQDDIDHARAEILQRVEGI